MNPQHLLLARRLLPTHSLRASLEIRSRTCFSIQFLRRPLPARRFKTDWSKPPKDAHNYKDSKRDEMASQIQNFTTSMFSSFQKTSTKILKASASASLAAGQQLGSFAGQQATKAGSYLWYEASSKSADLLSKASSGISKETSKLVHQAKQSTQSTLSRASSATAHVIKKPLAQANQAISDGAKAGMESVTKPLTQGWKQSRNLFLFWSLAAIAVYGVATTVPKEITKHYLAGAEVKEEKK